MFGFGTLVFYKYMAAGIVFVLLAAVFELVRSGRIVKRLRPAGGVEYSDILRHHEWVADMNLAITIGMVVLIEALVLLSPAHHANPWLRWPNAICGTGYLVLLLLIRYEFNGKKYPRIHYKLGYAGKALFFIAFLTGVPLLYQLPL